MTQYHININDKSYDVEILDDPRADEIRVNVNGEEFTVTAEEVGKPAVSAVAPARAAKPAPQTRAAAPAAAAPVAAGPGTVKSPLPGVIKSVKVREGQTVKAGDEVCVIEAMKAMNVIRAPQAGKIARVYVSEGTNISHGAPLMDIE
ncbi:MAG TPA: biotin/lipoyl-binding protein [Anaerolineaceae bacterium]|nr:biotin/lipoyl-binding protein [Anaerolineaceae bacterium]